MASAGGAYEASSGLGLTADGSGTAGGGGGFQGATRGRSSDRETVTWDPASCQAPAARASAAEGGSSTGLAFLRGQKQG